jgi:hypothetical protein
VDQGPTQPFGGDDAHASRDRRQKSGTPSGLPALRDGPLWQTARRLKAPILVSANAFSRWRTDIIGLRQWTGFETRWLQLVAQHPVALDSESDSELMCNELVAGPAAWRRQRR